MKHGNRFIDRTGQRYGSMVVKSYYGSHEKNRDALWLCVCDCGKEVIKRGQNLPKVKSCGNTCTAAWSTELPLIREDGEPFGIIYKLTNKVDGKIYIGQTVFSVEHRWKRHVEYAKRGGEGYLQKAIRMHGAKSFTQEKIATAYDKHQLDELEKHYILHFDSLNPEVGYNQTWRPSQDGEARQTMSEKNSGENNPSYRADLIDEELLELYNSGLSLSKIAERYGTDRRTLSLRFRKLGVEITLQPNQKSLPDEELASEYEAGASTAELAEKYGVSRWVITDRLRKANVKIREAKAPTNANGLKRTNVSTETLAAQFKAGVKLSDLARIHKMDRKTIRTRLQQAGIETRKNANFAANCWCPTTETVAESSAMVSTIL